MPELTEFVHNKPIFFLVSGLQVRKFIISDYKVHPLEGI